MARTPATEAESAAMEASRANYQFLIFDPKMLPPIAPAGIAARITGAGPVPRPPTHPRSIPPLGPDELSSAPAAIAHDLIARFPRPVDLVAVDFILEPATGSLPPAGPGWRTYPYGAHVLYLRIDA